MGLEAKNERKKIYFNNIIKKIIIGLMISLGLYGLGSFAYIIWNCMLYGGDDWEILISFNKYREGRFEIAVITLFLVSYLIGMGYLTVSTARKVYIQRKARLKAREINKLDYKEKINEKAEQYREANKEKSVKGSE